MNILFWALMLSMLLVAVIFLVYPLLRARRSGAIAYKDSNLGLYADKLAELEADLVEGRIDHEHYQLARQEIDRELLQDVPEESRETAGLHYGTQLKRQPGVAMIIAVFLPAMVLLVYMQLGMHAVSEQSQAQQVQQDQQKQEKMASVGEMTRKLAERLQQKGGSLEEWSMLGRAHKLLKQYDLASAAFGKAIEISPSAQLMLEQAEALALGNNQQFTPESMELIRRALELEPDNINVLWFAGVAEFQAGNYRDSIAHLSRLSAEAQQDPDIDRSIRMYIEKAREELIASGESVPPMAELLPAAPASTEPAQPGASLQVSVNVSQEVRDRFDSSDTVFIYAKAASGPRVPLAVQRISLDQLPATVQLDDSMAMMEGMKLSAFESVIISARITKTGSAMAQAGDYIGEHKVDNVAQIDQVNIEIDTLVQ